jgi:hypothetical protein
VHSDRNASTGSDQHRNGRGLSGRHRSAHVVLTEHPLDGHDRWLEFRDKLLHRTFQ